MTAPVAITGDTAWLLVSAALVLLMTPALGFFYNGLVRRKNVLATIMLLHLGTHQRAVGPLGLQRRLRPGRAWAD